MTELLTDPGHTRSDLNMIRAALRKGYDIPDELLAALPKVAGTLMLDKTQKGQVRLKAIEVLMAMKESDDKAKGVDKPPATSPSQTVVNVGVNVDNRTSDKPLTALQFVERYRQARLSGQVESGGT